MLKTIRRAEYAELITLFFIQGAALGMWLVPLSTVLDAHGFHAIKPFAFAELFARLRALGRRQPAVLSLLYQVADLQLDPRTHAASRAGRPISLTRTEFLLLEFMMRHQESVLRREALINAVWGYEGFGLQGYPFALRRAAQMDG